MTAQSKFNVVLPTQDNFGGALAAGQVTSLIFQIDGATYTYALPAGLAVGATVPVLFTALTPPFVPVLNNNAEMEAVDANGTGLVSQVITWTQVGVPAAPTFTVG